MDLYPKEKSAQMNRSLQKLDESRERLRDALIFREILNPKVIRPS